MRRAKAGRAGETSSQAGWGLPLHKLDKVQVEFLNIESLEDSARFLRRGSITLWFRTKSLQRGESPAMLPIAHTACSRTSSAGEVRRSLKMGTAPASITTLVWSAEPEAMLVRAQAASNYTKSDTVTLKLWTNLEGWAVVTTQELNKSGYQTSINYVLNGRIVLCGGKKAR